MSSFDKNSNLSVIAVLDTAILQKKVQYIIGSSPIMTTSASLLCKYSGVKHGKDSKFTELEIEPSKYILIF